MTLMKFKDHQNDDNRSPAISLILNRIRARLESSKDTESFSVSIKIKNSSNLSAGLKQFDLKTNNLCVFREKHWALNQMIRAELGSSLCSFREI